MNRWWGEGLSQVLSFVLSYYSLISHVLEAFSEILRDGEKGQRQHINIFRDFSRFRREHEADL